MIEIDTDKQKTYFSNMIAALVVTIFGHCILNIESIFGCFGSFRVWIGMLLALGGGGATGGFWSVWAQEKRTNKIKMTMLQRKRAERQLRQEREEEEKNAEIINNRQ